MSVNARDLLVLHTNVNRLVGEEIFANKCLANNDFEIINSMLICQIKCNSSSHKTS